MTDYFSDRENGPRARIEQMISSTVWAGRGDGAGVNQQRCLRFAVF